MSGQFILNRKIASDHWTRLGDEDQLPTGGDIIISLDRWNAEPDALKAHPGGIGVVVPNTIDVEDLSPNLPHWQLIALEFPEFTDGRAYSQARILRSRCDFKGQIRATGNVLRDQLYYMHRCGFDAMELAQGRDPQDALHGFDDFSEPYQPSVRGGQTMFRRRAAST